MSRRGDDDLLLPQAMFVLGRVQSWGMRLIPQYNFLLILRINIPTIYKYCSWNVCCTLMEVDRAKYIPTSDSLFSLTKKTCHTKQLGGFSIIFLGEVYKTFRVCPQAAKKRSLSPPLSGCSSSARWRYARMISSSAASSSTPAGDQQSENIWLLSNNPICSM